jgi:hypothetical protein
LPVLESTNIAGRPYASLIVAELTIPTLPSDKCGLLPPRHFRRTTTV